MYTCERAACTLPVLIDRELGLVDFGSIAVTSLDRASEGKGDKRDKREREGGKIKKSYPTSEREGWKPRKRRGQRSGAREPRERYEMLKERGKRSAGSGGEDEAGG